MMTSSAGADLMTCGMTSFEGEALIVWPQLEDVVPKTFLAILIIVVRVSYFTTGTSLYVLIVVVEYLKFSRFTEKPKKTKNQRSKDVGTLTE